MDWEWCNKSLPDITSCRRLSLKNVCKKPMVKSYVGSILDPSVSVSYTHLTLPTTPYV